MSINSRFIKASAGTGKTYTIIEEVTKMVTDESIPIQEILIVTYTEKAVGELKERIRKALEKNCINAEDSRIFTIHSFCQRVLEDYAVLAGQPAELELIDDSEIEQFVDNWLRSSLPENVEKYLETDSKDGIRKKVNDLKRDLVKALSEYNTAMEIESESEWEKDKEKDYIRLFSEKDLLKKLYKEWQEKKAGRKVQTYSDMIGFVWDRIAGNRKNLKLIDALREKYAGAIIDEFQDTNRYQWDIFKELFFGVKDKFLFVVGDEKQSIFGFQGADLKVYHVAEEEYKAISDKRDNEDVLKYNWRSSQKMIEECNEFFSGGFFEGSKNSFTDSSFPVADKYSKEPELCGKELFPFWFYESGNDETEYCNEHEFADFAVKRILFCCSPDSQDPTKTNLRIPELRKKTPKDPKNYAKDENSWHLRNVDFSDFAILARTSTEMGAIESALRRENIPYTRYKDRNLFNSMECQHWISLLNAIDADDFSGKNRAILSEALFTKFFDISLADSVSSDFDSPTNPCRNVIWDWHELAEKRKWADLIDSVFEKTHIEHRLSSEGKIQSLSRFRQIGMYVLEVLYENACSLEDVIRILTKKMTQKPDEGDLVERGTDRECVQVMTIHASKGLEFPVVIPVAGFKGRFTAIPHVYTYYNESDKKIMSFSANGNTKHWEAYQDELKRLFYVAYTRAQFLIILPRYSEPQKYKEDFDFLRKSINKYIENHKENVNERIFSPISSKPSNLNQFFDNNDSELIEGRVTGLSPLLTTKYSYSSLAPRKNRKSDNLEFAPEDGRHPEDDNGENDSDDSDTPQSAVDPNPIAPKYPKGSSAGNAVHTIFELADFSCFGNFKSFEDLSEDPSFRNLVRESFWKESFDIDEEDSKNILKQTASYVWNTLNARLPFMLGGSVDYEKAFNLKEICSEDRFAEKEFHLNSVSDAVFVRNYCMGYMDLVFRRNVKGEEIFSILDWKTDTRFDGKQIDYADRKCVNSVVDSEYNIQRTLYSYCLIKWLLGFGKYGKTEQEVFDKHFGGIYYVMIRGCEKDTDKGIYPHYWHSWDDLVREYNDIILGQMQ